MTYDLHLADRIREYLMDTPHLTIEEKEMFRGLCFMVNNKMCICVSGENLMCRFDPLLHEEVMGNRGVLPMVMKGKELSGYCYVTPDGFKMKKDFNYWMGLCLAFNERAKSSKKRRKV